ncbi:carboxymuconolactone decarboxylase family protein [Winogradskyella schleiferi]|uniref:carboxymuconolactone decarboxylase family protein n=1 Tax=Winogradskyella schleiferi TaxID=2686078 RepID=UPI0015BF4425|nr:carboxymuconolactone decarboxylase family protein [Winogradskyella schleiferi]
MTTLKVNTIESAPEESKASLKQSVKAFGMLPGLHGVLASSPQILEAYKTLHSLFSDSSFNDEELTVVWQTINVEHECHYCVPAHTGIANMMKVNPELSEALRNRNPMPSEKLQVLHDFTLKLVRNRGNVTEEDLNAFYKAGYEERQVLEVILGISQKVISNYTNHIANTPVDKAFQKYAWEPQAA